jgi:hypothetical protein
MLCTPDLDLPASARRAVAQMIKARARAYAKRPIALEALYPGLADAAPTKHIAIAASLVDRESRSPRRWFAFGGAIGLTNARAALLLGRVRRRFGESNQAKDIHERGVHEHQGG